MDHRTDASNCGTCGNSCASHLVCLDGTCSCPEGKEECNGHCVDLETNFEHCGACSQSCLNQSNSDGGVCVAGACVLNCLDGWADCDGIAENGCEVQLSDDAEHCGACGSSCYDLLNVSGVVCLGGSCEIMECDPGWADCDRNPETGCEIHVAADEFNCGRCDISCFGLPNSEAMAACSDGGCVLQCAAGWEDCDGLSENGCEAHTLSDPLNCNACGTFCTRCDDGSCDVAVQVFGGAGFSCALFDGGFLSCWGGNEAFWSAGESQKPDTPAPFMLQQFEDIEILSKGMSGRLICIARPNNEVWCWGDANRMSPDATGQASRPFLVKGLPSEEIKDLTVAFHAACALTSSGEVWCWGFGQSLGHGTTGAYSPELVEGFGEKVVEVSSGLRSFCARTESGQAWCWGTRMGGDNYNTQTPVPERVEGLSDVRSLSISSHSLSMCAVVGEGDVKCWGDNAFSRLGDPDPKRWVSEPLRIEPLGEVLSVGLGQKHGCALTTAGEVYCWGNNDDGQLGIEAEASLEPVLVEGLSDVVEIAVADNHTCARQGDNQMLCWGSNAFGQLGRGETGPGEAQPSFVEFRAHATE